MGAFNLINYCSNHKRFTVFVIGVFFVFAHLVIANNTRKDGMRYVFWSDALGYYTYLPSLFIYHDIEINSYGSVCPETNKPVNKYTSGVATLELPFFLIAHGVAQMTESNPNGMSETYEFFITMGTILYSYIGLVLLFFILQRYVRKRAALLSVILIYFGTNLYYYTIGESGMSHAYSFFTLSWFIWALHLFIDKPTWKTALQMGFAFGLSVIIRPTNGLIIILPFFLGIKGYKELLPRIQFFIKEPLIYLAVLAMFIAMAPQLIYWKMQTGSFLFYSYPGETFSNINNPKIADVLFGNASGLFVYSPLLLLFIPGLIVLFVNKHRFLALSIALIFCLITFLNASWWIPTFDCGFGHRAFIEYYPLLSIPIALFIESISNKWGKLGIYMVMAVLIFVNVRFSFLYKKYPCWKADYGYEWTWDNVAYAVRIAFFVDHRPTEHLRKIEKN